ncbi:helix-turn-helix domain-containing protein [Vitreoscilla massiliensis]|uniref:Helix-turn-helix domain-containing protein n=1 Tax=Vitreoscilla massiliensis TaxID=1689272 RepID=A0ABY4E5D4_9NEIS|nr:YdaS family helix-turn-helix protein [Vitreoscilla massiliensis]UOO89538.1 helix-turn-helix domain-containing protein [Vitreoscilla massiliensis]
MTAAINKAVQVAGGQSKLARLIGRDRKTINSWVKGRNQITPSAALDIEDATGVSAYDLAFESLLKARNKYPKP